MKLEWGTYKHFPYERELALREAETLIGPGVNVSPAGDVHSEKTDLAAAQLLTYFSSIDTGDQRTDTVQRQLELSAATRSSRQSTRYSVHGLHEYRGKFNPQICRALVNILEIPTHGVLLDPFCGSGTTLVEAAHRGVHGVGTDLNPLAVFIANAKLRALTTPAGDLNAALERILEREPRSPVKNLADARQAYLEVWFEPVILVQIERLRSAIEVEEDQLGRFFLVVASNLLRDFSLQDPADLRIRRRDSANADVPFLAVFKNAASEAIRKLASAQEVVGTELVTGHAYLRDNRSLTSAELPKKVDAAISSPPYATALPYIDTQRLSLIWLSLLQPHQIGKVEADLTGSREMKVSAKRSAVEALRSNASQLPDAEARFCLELQRALSDTDGFRRQAVPLLLYRYFDQMAQTFRSVAKLMKPGAPFALIVGHNHTVLGGNRFEIDTPQHLTSLAEQAGWIIDEVTSLQAYQRYGLHASNAVKTESLIILRANALPSR